MSKISALSSATYSQSDDVYTLVQSSTNKKITKLLLDTQMDWTLLASGTYTTTPVAETSAFASISAWSTPLTPSLGTFIRPTVANGYIYECVTSGAVGGAEPSWGTTLGDDTADNAASWRCRGASVIATVNDFRTRIPVGCPLKYTYGGTTYYGMCIANSATRLALCGAPLLTNGALTALYAGRPHRAMYVAMGVSGSYDSGTGALTPLPQYIWQGPKAYLVTYAVRHVTDDTGASNAYVNVGVNGAVVSASGDGAAADKGTLVDAAAWATNSDTAIKAANYDINRGEALCPWIGTQGSNTDATILSVVATFVLE